MEKLINKIIKKISIDETYNGNINNLLDGNDDTYIDFRINNVPCNIKYQIYVLTIETLKPVVPKYLEIKQNNFGNPTINTVRGINKEGSYEDIILPSKKSYSAFRISVTCCCSGKNDESVSFTHEINEILFYGEYEDKKYLLKQNNNYHTTKSNLQPLGQPTDNIQLKIWFDKHGVDDINILTETLSKKETPMTKEETVSIWKTDFELNANDITGNIELIDTDENNKSIKYDCNNYRILDLLQDKFDIMMLKEK